MGEKVRGKGKVKVAKEDREEDGRVANGGGVGG